MPSDPEFVQFVIDQIDASCDISCRAMFGGHTLYSHGKVVGLIGDNQLFVKPTEAGRAFIGDVVEAPAYEGARPSFLIGDRVEDGEWLTELIRTTERELPPPKRKRKA